MTSAGQAPKSLHLAKADRLIGCLRVSKVNGREGESFMSPPEQRESMHGWATQHGAEIVDIVKELDKSGKTTERDGLLGALARVEAGEADGIIVAEVDRFSRNLERGLRVVRRLDETGKAFVAVKNGIEPGMTQTSDGWLKLSFYLLIAELQLRQYTERWATAKRRHVAAGTANSAGYGYRKSGVRRDGTTAYGPLEPDPAQAPGVKLIFERRADGMSWAAIAESLERQRFVAPGGGKWLPQTVRRIVMGANRGSLRNATGNRLYLGELRVGGEVNPRAHPPLVSEATWKRAVGQKMTAARSDRSPFLLTGLVRCATCGGRMAGHRRKAKSAKRPRRPSDVTDYRYYGCRTTYTWGKCPRPAMANADGLERHVVQAFRARFLDIEVIQESAGGSAALDAARAELDAVEADRDFFIMRPGNARLGADKYDEMLDDHHARVAAAQAVVAAEAAKITGAALPSDLAMAWDDLDSEDQRGFLSDVFAVVAVKWNGQRQGIPIEDRVRIWAHDETGRPEGLPGRGTASCCVPIRF